MQSEPVPDARRQASNDEIEEGRVAALLAYIPFMCFVPLLKMPQNRFARRHGQQGLVLFLVELLALVFYIPFVSRHFWAFVFILALLASIYGMFQVLQGRDWKIPFLGEMAEKFKL